MPICHFQKMVYGLDVGGGCGYGPVFLISVVSYHYIIFVSTSVSLACIHVLGSPAGQAICLGAHVNMPPMNVFALLACKNEYMNTHVLACPVLIHKYICTYMHPMHSRINSWSPCKNKYMIVHANTSNARIQVLLHMHSLNDHALDKRIVRGPDQRVVVSSIAQACVAKVYLCIWHYVTLGMFVCMCVHNSNTC